VPVRAANLHQRREEWEGFQHKRNIFLNGKNCFFGWYIRALKVVLIKIEENPNCMPRVTSRFGMRNQRALSNPDDADCCPYQYFRLGGETPLQPEDEEIRSSF
jgi:hypothetical protein